MDADKKSLSGSSAAKEASDSDYYQKKSAPVTKGTPITKPENVTTSSSKKDLRSTMTKIITNMTINHIASHLPTQADLSRQLLALLDAPVWLSIDTAAIALIEAGADVNAANSSGETALMLANDSRRIAITNHLLASPDIRVNQVDHCGNTALMCAAFKGQSATVAALLSAQDILVNHANRLGDTALMVAIANDYRYKNNEHNYNCTATVTALLAAPGINHLENQDGDTAITLAYEQGYHNIVRLLQTRGAILPPHLRQEEAQAERERQTAAIVPVPVLPSTTYVPAVVFSCNTRGLKFSGAEVVNAPEPQEAAVEPVGRYPKPNTRSFKGVYPK